MSRFLWKKRRDTAQNGHRIVRWCVCGIGSLIVLAWELYLHQESFMELPTPSLIVQQPPPRSIEDHKASLTYMGNRKTNTGWNVDTLCLQHRPIWVYGVGAGEDISWDIGMYERYGATVVIIDPTEKAKSHVETVLKSKSYDEIQFLPEGLSDRTGEITFALPANPSHVSMRSVDLADAKMLQNTVTAPVRRLQDIMRSLQHEYLDVLKLDIEGAEYSVLENLLNEDYLPFTQLLVEYHDRFLTDRSRHDALLRRLSEAGFVELWSQNGGQERGYIKRNDLLYCADGTSKRTVGSGSSTR